MAAQSEEVDTGGTLVEVADEMAVQEVEPVTPILMPGCVDEPVAASSTSSRIGATTVSKKFAKFGERVGVPADNLRKVMLAENVGVTAPECPAIADPSLTDGRVLERVLPIS